MPLTLVVLALWALAFLTFNTVVAETLAFPLATATALVGMVEIRRDRTRPARGENLAGG
ncbi:hypothetical protein ACFYV5_05370 [Streptomyces sp. NPDC003035]|uniref:hypothetical protein n=1 Tax=Streptomyces sp. NPDC003035 TaxID=3364676 RepID=UPI0036885F48